MLADLRGRGLGRNGDRGSSHQYKNRRRARLGLVNGAVVGDDEPVPGGKFHGVARRDCDEPHAGRPDRAGKLHGERWGHVPVGVEPLGDVLGDGARSVHAGLAQHGKRGVAHGVARPRHIGGELVSRAAVRDLGVKEPVRLVGVRDRARHREGARRGAARGGGYGRFREHWHKRQPKHAKKGDEPAETGREAAVTHDSPLPSLRRCDTGASGRPRWQEAWSRPGRSPSSPCGQRQARRSSTCW